jgi:hypothetical protein
MERNSTKQKKEKMIQALEQSLGVVAQAVRRVGIDRKTHYNWLESDPEYKEAVREIENIALDEVESIFLDMVRSKDRACVLYYLRTKGKRRGYGSEHSKEDPFGQEDLYSGVEFVNEPMDP